MRLAVLALACSACNVVFPLRDEQPPTPDVGPVLDTSGADTGPPCSDDLVDEDFDEVSAMPCGNATQNGQGLSRVAGKLVVQPPDNRAGCTTVGIAFAVASVEVVSVPATPLMFSELAIESVPRVAIIVVRDGDGDATIAVDVAGDRSNASTYDANQHRFWRLRAAAGTVVAETSADGLDYALLLQTQVPAPQNIKISIAGGVQPGQSVVTPGATVFDNLGACP